MATVWEQFDYLKLQCEGKAPRTDAEHAQYKRWKEHDPEWIALQQELEELRSQTQ